MDHKWTAYGLPIAGSSGIYKNKKAEISPHNSPKTRKRKQTNKIISKEKHL